MGNVNGNTKNTTAQFVPVSTPEEMEQVLSASSEQPVVLFKHDYACGTSVHAYYDLARVPGEIALIDVEKDHALSQALAARLGVKHESPQVIVVRDGQPVYAASHWSISPDDVTRAAGRDDASDTNSRAGTAN
jgi:bacillithiol system protein YtxJ